MALSPTPTHSLQHILLHSFVRLPVLSALECYKVGLPPKEALTAAIDDTGFDDNKFCVYEISEVIADLATDQACRDILLSLGVLSELVRSILVLSNVDADGEGDSDPQDGVRSSSTAIARLAMEPAGAQWLRQNAEMTIPVLDFLVHAEDVSVQESASAALFQVPLSLSHQPQC